MNNTDEADSGRLRTIIKIILLTSFDISKVLLFESMALVRLSF